MSRPSISGARRSTSGSQLSMLRVDGERLAVGLERARLVAAGHVDVAEPGPGAEMARLARQHLAEVRHRARRVVEEEEGGGAPVPGLGPVGLQGEIAVEEFDGEREFLAPASPRRPGVIRRSAVSLPERDQRRSISLAMPVASWLVLGGRRDDRRGRRGWRAGRRPRDAAGGRGRLQAEVGLGEAGRGGRHGEEHRTGKKHEEGACPGYLVIRVRSSIHAVGQRLPLPDGRSRQPWRAL